MAKWSCVKNEKKRTKDRALRNEERHIEAEKEKI